MKAIHARWFYALALVSCSVFAHGNGPTDPQIAAIVVVANQVDIDAGKLARDKTGNKDVREFATLMVTDHSAVNKSASELVQKLKVAPEPNATSDSLQQGGDKNLAALKGLNGAAFDKAYVDHEVAYHKQVNGALETLLIPSAQNAELKRLLETGLKIFQGHEEHAEHVQSELK